MSPYLPSVSQNPASTVTSAVDRYSPTSPAIHRRWMTGPRPGRWEADQIIGKNSCSSMMWLTERVSRFLIPITMPYGYDAEAVGPDCAKPLTESPHTCDGRSPSTKNPNRPSRPGVVVTVSVCAW